MSFLPRQVAQSLKSQQLTPSRPNATQARAAPAVASGSDVRADATEKSQTGYSFEDIEILVCLATSDHALWSDPDLRYLLEESNSEGGENFIPLSYLLRTSLILSDLRQDCTEAFIVKALRSIPSEHVEVRMLLSSPPPSWGRARERDKGGYEIRRKHDNSSQSQFTKAYWEDRTIYLENVPPPYRTIPGIVRLTRSLLQPELGSASQFENVILPAHHQDKPGDVPKCKGFALVTFSDTKCLETLLKDWPWDSNHSPLGGPESNEVVGEAVKFGFHTLQKKRWDGLQEEYLAYREKLLNEIKSLSDELPEAVSHPVNLSSSVSGLEERLPQSGPSSITILSSDPYPSGCLIFVKNVHVETNKTTLRRLFCRAFPDHSGDGLQYVDYSKGMDSCHLRMSTPSHARLLRDFFTTHAISQAHGLDDAATTVASPSEGTPLVMEVVQGRKEEVYWERVPESVRRQAVQQAIKRRERDNGTGTEAGVGLIDDGIEKSGKKRRKRRKEGKDDVHGM